VPATPNVLFLATRGFSLIFSTELPEMQPVPAFHGKDDDRTWPLASTLGEKTTWTDEKGPGLDRGCSASPWMRRSLVWRVIGSRKQTFRRFHSDLRFRGDRSFDPGSARESRCPSRLCKRSGPSCATSEKPATRVVVGRGHKSDKCYRPVHGLLGRRLVVDHFENR
jgi:hypothetical protein